MARTASHDHTVVRRQAIHFGVAATLVLLAGLLAMGFVIRSLWLFPLNWVPTGQ